ncbi:MAG: SpoIIE family protein phosphatase [Phycisphaerales bacterium]|nr:SpoIIE family protein phosphatase [Phycisphaerales bacterium]
MRVLEVARRLGGTSDVEEILGLVIDALRDLLGAERATVFQYDAAAHELYTRVAHGLDDSARREFRFRVERGLASECCLTRRLINVPDCYADPRFTPEVDRRTGYRTRNLLCIPLVATDGSIVGVGQVLNKKGGTFSKADEFLAEALGMQAAVALQRAMLFEAKLRQEKLDADVALAQRMQEATWPTHVPQPAGYEIAVHLQPAEETGGDACDVFDVPGFGTILFIADATGHGLGPALSVTQARAMVRVAMRCGVGIEQAVRHINAQLCEDLPPGRFITAFLGRLDVEAGRIEFHSAGQGPLLHYHAATGAADLREANGLPLGILDHADVEGVELGEAVLAPGDVYAVLSDGFFEAVDAAGRPFGNEAIVRIICESQGCRAEEILRNVVSAVNSHCAPRSAEDDRTALVIRRRPEEVRAD